jgi:hypothetical protein
MTAESAEQRSTACSLTSQKAAGRASAGSAGKEGACGSKCPVEGTSLRRSRHSNRASPCFTAASVAHRGDACPPLTRHCGWTEIIDWVLRSRASPIEPSAIKDFSATSHVERWRLVSFNLFVRLAFRMVLKKSRGEPIQEARCRRLTLNNDHGLLVITYV